MTTLEMLVVTGLYMILLVAVIYFTRATLRRVAGAFVGALAASLMALGVIALCEALGLWNIPFEPNLYFLPIFYLGTAITLAPVYLITWRLARRFGWRGLAIFIGIVAIIGPPRDYLYAITFPAWMVFAPGIAPILADSAAYVSMVVLGHAVMRVISGPARQDRLARQPPP
ncbi:MAG: hypothetical protein ABI999_11460 [Acidobacteriota bacterium]